METTVSGFYPYSRRAGKQYKCRVLKETETQYKIELLEKAHLSDGYKYIPIGWTCYVQKWRVENPILPDEVKYHEYMADLRAGKIHGVEKP